MTEPEKPVVPDALLVLTSVCPFCPTVLQALAGLVKAGGIGRLEVINLSIHPEAARTLGVRTVPWVRIGPFEFEGLRSKAELEHWAERAGTQEGMAEYLSEQLATGNLEHVVALAAREHANLDALLRLLANPETDLHVRVGIGAVMEDLQGSEQLKAMVGRLGTLTRHTEARIRGDACHYLGLTRSPAALPYVRRLLDDDDAQVRELAADSLALLAGDATPAT